MWKKTIQNALLHSSNTYTKKEERIAQQGFFGPPFRSVNIYIYRITLGFKNCKSSAFSLVIFKYENVMVVKESSQGF